MDLIPDTGDGALKRPCQPAVPDATEQAAKRVCLSGAGTQSNIEPPAQGCLHCNSTEHTSATCGHHQPGPLTAVSSALSAPSHELPIRFTAPAPAMESGGRDQLPLMAVGRPALALEGVSSDRLAMIAAAPPDMPDISESIDEACGPRQSGMNLVPLGPRRSTLSRSPSSGASPAEPARAQHSEHLLHLRARVEATRSQGYAHAASHPADRMMGFNAPPHGLRPGSNSLHGRLNAPPPPPPSNPVQGQLNAPPPPPARGRVARRKARPKALPKAQTGNSSALARGLPQPTAGPFVQKTAPGTMEQAEKLKTGGGPPPQVALYGAQNMGTWAVLTAHIHTVVQGAVDASRVRNNGSDQQAVGRAIQAANDILRPLILRDKFPTQPQQTQLTRQLIGRVAIVDEGMDQDDDGGVRIKVE